MGNVFEEELFDVVVEAPLTGAWAGTAGGFTPEEAEDEGGGGLGLLPPVLVSKKGDISYRTLQLPNSA